MGKGHLLQVLSCKEIYVAGELLNGYVYMEVCKPISCNYLRVHFNGREIAAYDDQDDNIYFSKTIISEKLDLIDPFGNNYQNNFMLIQPGKYSFPFEFLLPTDLPSTFKFGGAEIKYELEVEVSLLKKDMREAKEIQIRALPTYRPTEYSTDTLTSEKNQLRFMGMLDKGSCTLTAKLKNDKNIYYEHESISLIVNVENKSKVKISDIKCELVQQIGCREAPHERILSKQLYAGIGAGQSINDFKISLSLISLNKELYPSISNSSLVVCKYFVKVTCGVFMCPDLKISIPIEILASPPENSNSLPYATTVDKTFDSGFDIPTASVLPKLARVAPLLGAGPRQ